MRNINYLTGKEPPTLPSPFFPVNSQSPAPSPPRPANPFVPKMFCNSRESIDLHHNSTPTT